MKVLHELKHLIKLKDVQRYGGEGVAAHTWSCLVMAEVFLKRIKSRKLDELRVLKLLMFHDLVEVEAGDTYFLDEKNLPGKKDREAEGFKRLLEKVPVELKDEYRSLFEEFEAMETPESQFAHAMDKLEPFIQWLHVPDWKASFGFSEQLLRAKKEPSVNKFPELKEFFEEMMTHLKSKGYF